MSISYRFILLIALVLLASLGWFVAWNYMATSFADTLSKTVFNGERGRIGCKARSTTGFPFRFSEVCENALIGDGTASGEAEATLGELSLTALPYQPNRAIIEAEGPLNISPINGLPALLNWDQARASLRHDFELLSRVDAEMVAARLEGGLLGNWSLARGEFHMRQTPESVAGADISFKLVGLTSDRGSATEAVDLILTMSADPAQSLTSGQAQDLLSEWQRAGKASLEVTQFDVAIGDSRLSATGSLEVNERGRVTGDLNLEIVEAGEMIAALSAGYFDLPVSSGTLNTAMMAMGSVRDKDGQDALGLNLRIENGQVRFGFLTLGEIPSLYDLK